MAASIGRMRPVDLGTVCFKPLPGRAPSIFASVRVTSKKGGKRTSQEIHTNDTSRKRWRRVNKLCVDFAELKTHVIRSGNQELDFAQQDPGDATTWREARLRDY